MRKRRIKAYRSTSTAQHLAQARKRRPVSKRASVYLKALRSDRARTKKMRESAIDYSPPKRRRR